ncbi:ATP-binding protein [uncultured Tepidimonas sp.]|uniref:ATP-binding protein n=1 Tax=uncultured Tepidimonas sp. TaxID=453579 RepID=UPI002609A659|nr:ATP-binding protein [uncultured Tepidimonas sp.]
MKRKKLPIGIQTFRDIREGGYYYVDKTAFAHRLATTGKYYFLSRPRRFGKSLFLDTLAELFAGNEPLFRGLYCHDKWDWAKKHPVIRISFGGGRLESREQLERRIDDLLRINQESLGISCPPGLDIPGRFGELIRRAEHRFGQRVVILVDEYDKPILDNLTEPEVARAMREGLRNLYSVIKDQDAHIRFAFLTGVSKFSKVSIFSGLNNLRDITVSAEYSAICGYTEADVDTVFAPELEGLDRQAIRDWYNGYNWLGDSVYNPFDLLLFFQERVFRPYWFETGTPTFLIDVLTERRFYTPRLEKVFASEALLSAFDVERLAPEALLWQTGYLTFHGQRQVGARIEYQLSYPNLEVEASLNDALLKGLMGDESQAEMVTSRLFVVLQEGALDELHRHIDSLYAAIPHDWYRNNPIAQHEGYWASVFYSHIAALGLDLIAEDVTSQGRIDLTVKLPERIYLFEFKVIELEPEGKALAQLKARDYAAKYRAAGVPIHLVGIEFSRDSRRVVGLEVETLA